MVQYDIAGKKYYSEIITVSLNAPAVNVFLNPATEEFTIQISGVGSIFITNVLGRILYSSNIDPSLQYLKVGKKFPQGTYIIKIITADDSRIIKVVKD